MFTKDFPTALRLAEKVLQPSQASRSNPSTPLELDAVNIQHWVLVMSSIQEGVAERRKLQPIEVYVRSQPQETVEVDEWMAYAKSKAILRQLPEALNIYNQIIATFSWYLPALSEKALLLTSMGGEHIIFFLKRFFFAR